MLDVRNPRIVTPQKLKWQEEILQYLFDHEDLILFVKKIASEGKNAGAERPYIVKSGGVYTVIEGNSRIAAYKVLAGLMVAPEQYAGAIPEVSALIAQGLLTVDCSIAPNRDALLPIMANSHFGLGDKSKWGYLGSRKAVYDEWVAGKAVPQLAKVFDRTEGQIKDLITEYLLYLEAAALPWTKKEKAILQKPSVQFNPPVRFLQTKGHKEKLGISYGVSEPSVIFANGEAKKKYKHLILKLVVATSKGLGATATYDAVFKDFDLASSDVPNSSTGPGSGSATSGVGSGSGPSSSGAAGAGAGAGAAGAAGTSGQASAAGGSAPSVSPPSLKPGALFAYQVTLNDALITQLMKEAAEISCKKYPAAATFLLRNVVEAILKNIIHGQKANPASQALDLERSLNLCLSKSVNMPQDEKSILKEFSKSHLLYLNLGAHGNVIPNHDRTMSVRDCIDKFVKNNV